MTTSRTNDAGPALLLMFFAPLLTEVLPGATRFSSFFVFPIEICVWGGGALLIRYIVRTRQLNWVGMLLLAISLAIAEEFLIQQTSVAPMVIRLKGVTYARFLGVNYVYLLWALIYESVFVVFLPVYLVELLFPARRERPWVNRTGLVIIIPLFLIASLLAWYTWTQIARSKVFKMPAYKALWSHTLMAVAIILLLIRISLKQRNPPRSNPTGRPAPALLIFISGACFAALLFGMVLLGFGIAPQFPPGIAITGGLLLIAVALWLVPGQASRAGWQARHQFFLISGVITGSMLISFIGFIGASTPDLYFKIITNTIALVLLCIFAFRMRAGNHIQYIPENK